MKPFRTVFVHAAFESLGIEYLSAYLGRHGFETGLVFDPRLFDDSFISIRPLARLFDFRSRLAERTAHMEPDLVAFSVIATDYLWALDMASRIKKLRDVPVVFGGIHASAAPEAVLENQQVDYCIVGEGEDALLGLARSLRDGNDPKDVDNLCQRRNGTVQCNRLGPLIEDLDSLPFPDKRLFYSEVPGFRRHYTLLTRRGCTNQCSYCHNTMQRRLYPDAGTIRLRSVDNVLDELVQARATWNFNRLRINDDLFSHDTDWLALFCQRYTSDIGLPFMCSCSPNHLTDSVVADLKRAGAFQVCVGVQDVHDQVRREIYNRHTPQESVIRALASLRRHKLRSTVDNILGYPGQTEEQISDIAEFYLDNPVYGRFTVFWLIYYAGTAITESARKDGLLTDRDVSDLERDPPEQANTLVLKGSLTRLMTKLHLFLLMVQWLPRPVSRWTLRRRLYRFLPAINPSLVEGVWTAFSRDRLDPERRRYYIKYSHFGIKRLFPAMEKTVSS